MQIVKTNNRSTIYKFKVKMLTCMKEERKKTKKERTLTHTFFYSSFIFWWWLNVLCLNREHVYCSVQLPVVKKAGNTSVMYFRVAAPPCKHSFCHLCRHCIGLTLILWLFSRGLTTTPILPLNVYAITWHDSNTLGRRPEFALAFLMTHAELYQSCFYHFCQTNKH